MRSSCTRFHAFSSSQPENGTDLPARKSGRKKTFRLRFSSSFSEICAKMTCMRICERKPMVSVCRYPIFCSISLILLSIFDDLCAKNYRSSRLCAVTIKKKQSSKIEKVAVDGPSGGRTFAQLVHFGKKGQNGQVNWRSRIQVTSRDT